MILSALQFLIAILFSIVAAYVAGLSEGDIPIIAFLIPALWLLPKSGFSSVVMLLAMGSLALPYHSNRWRCLSVSGCLFRC